MGLRAVLAATVAAGATAAAATLPARAADCRPTSGLSPCIDADPLWLSPGSELFFVPGANDRGELTRVALAVSRISRPVVLRAPAPDPQGREIPVLERQTDATFLLSHRLGERLSLELAVPMVFDRRGTGIEGITSSIAPRLPPSSLRDPRAGASFVLTPKHAPGRLEVASRFDVSLPAGDERHFAGERGPVAQPAVVVDARRGPVSVGSSIGLRLRQPVALADARFGTSLWVSLGAGVGLLAHRRLVAALEAYLLPSLVRSRGSVGAESTSVVPAEWMLSLRSVLHPGLVVQAGAGTGLPLSTRHGHGFTAPTSPAWRTLGSVTLSYPLEPSATTHARALRKNPRRSAPPN